MSRLVLVLLFLIFFPSLCFSNGGSNICSGLFQPQVSSVAYISGSVDTHWKSELDKILLNQNTLEKIDTIRRKYDGYSPESRMGATVQYLALLRDLADIPYQKNISESEKKVLERGIDNLMQDFTQISPRFISTERIISENIAVINALAARESIKEFPVNRAGNVVSISTPQFKNNSEYLNARRVTFELIDTYAAQNYIPHDILSERIDELLIADVRYQMLALEDKYLLSARIVKSLEDPSHEGTEKILEIFFSTREKVRIL